MAPKVKRKWGQLRQTREKDIRVHNRDREPARIRLLLPMPFNFHVNCSLTIQQNLSSIDAVLKLNNFIDY